VLGPVLEQAAEARKDAVVLAKVDTDANPALAARFGIQGIPAVKAFRDGEVVSEFVGAQPPPMVERFFDELSPSPADELIEAGDEESRRRAVDLDPGRADAALALARRLHERGEDEQAIEVLGKVSGSFEADGLAAHIELERSGPDDLAEALSLIDHGRPEDGLDALIEHLRNGGAEHADEIRRVVIGVLAELGQATDTAREYRRRLTAALG
jgi:putative thioredoxin